MTDREVWIGVTRRAISIEYRARVNTQYLAMMGLAGRAPAALTDAERDRIAQQIEDLSREHLTLTLNNAITELATQTRSCRAIDGGVSVSIAYSARLGAAGSDAITVFLVDNNPHFGEGEKPAFWLQGRNGVTDLRSEKGGRAIKFRFRQGSVQSDAPAPAPARKPVGAAEAVAEDRETTRLTAFLKRKDISLGVVLLALGAAFVLGAAHALSPGHGKAVVAGYLIGSRGRVRDAVLLGGVVTFTHVVSVVVIGVVALVLSQFVVPQTLFPWLSGASGFLILIVGFWLLARMSLGENHHHHGHSHSHSHGHGHPHSHEDDPVGHDHAAERDHGHSHEHAHDSAHADERDHDHGEASGQDEPGDHGHNHSHTPAGKATLGSLLSLGIAGGMVPCPTALVVLLTAVALRRIPFGLLIILVFSLGLASVLIGIGVLTVSASKLVTRFDESRTWIRRLPIASSAIIMIVGLLIIFRALVDAGVVSLNL
jgi:ABC-type nickel/cobalt efflux system permease component RcnA